MVELHTIVSYIIEKFQCMVFGEYETSRLVNRTELLHEHTIFDLHTLYLSDNQDLILSAVERSGGSIAVMCDSTICIGLTAVHLHHSPKLAELFHAVNLYFQKNDELTSMTGKLYQSLNTGRTLTELLADASIYFNGPVSICDASFQFLATTPGNDNGIGYLPQKEIASLKRFHIVDKIYRSHQAFSSVTPDYPDMCWIFCPVRISNVIIGFLAVSIGDKKADSFQLRLATILADVSSVLLSRTESRMTRTGLNYEDFLVDLLDGKYNDEAFVRSRISLFEKKFLDNSCILCFSGNQDYDRQVFLRRQMQSLRQYYTSSMSVVYQNSVVLFLTQSIPFQFDDTFYSRIGEFVGLNHMKVGISQPFSEILSAGTYFKQSYAALTLGETKYPNQNIYSACDLLPQMLLGNCSIQELHAGIHYHLQILTEYDRQNHTELLLSLHTFLEQDRNAAKAADHLGIHRSTLFYRLKKIEELLSVSLTDSALLFLYELSFCTLDYLRL